MTVEETLAEYHAPNGGTGFGTKAGMRAEHAPGLELLLRRADLSIPRLLDATGSGGRVAFGAIREGVTVLEPSAAALRCALSTFRDTPVSVAAGAPWDAPPEVFGGVLLAPPTDRGTLRVLAELCGAHAALVEKGVLYLVMHKDQGGKRYEKVAKELFGGLEVVFKSGGWRLSRAVKRRTETAPVELLNFEAAGLELEAEPGVFAAGKLDPGTAFLLETVDVGLLAGARVLDIGCGYGMLSLKASLAGAAVTALDDDISAVRSTYRNARHYGLDVRVLHSDVNGALRNDERFDAVLMNPPFHVGKRVALEVPRAFLAAAGWHLERSGTLTLVANKALAYERDLAPWAEVEILGENGAFKVLRAVKR